MSIAVSDARPRGLFFARKGAEVDCCVIQESISPRIDQLMKDKEGGQAVFANIDVIKQIDCNRMLARALDFFGDLGIFFNSGVPVFKKKFTIILTRSGVLCLTPN